MLEEKEANHKYFNLYRWDIFRMIRDEREAKRQAILKVMERAKKCIIRGHTYLYLKLVYDRFVEHREALRLQALK